MTAVVAVISLFLAAVLLLVPGGVPALDIPVRRLLLALVGVLAGLDDHTVRQHDPPGRRTAPTRVSVGVFVLPPGARLGGWGFRCSLEQEVVIRRDERIRCGHSVGVVVGT